MNDGSSVGRAEEYINKGFTNVMALKGGVQAWMDAGYPFA
jgi:rhodanese-related sulfurtransferase